MSSLTATPHPGPPRPPGSRLRPGVHLLSSRSREHWLLAEPGERFTRLHGPSEVLARLQPELHGAPLAPDPSLAEARTGLQQVLRSAGALEPVDPVATGAAQPPRISLWGHGAVATQVQHLLAHGTTDTPGPSSDPVSEGMVDSQVIPSTTPRVLHASEHAPATAPQDGLAGPVPDCDVLITCAQWLPDQRFSELDAECHRRGIAWHHCHAEGSAISIGPLQVPGGTRYRDWRGRRLAASTTPEELLDLWAYLEAPGACLPPVPAPSAPLAAIAAGLLLADVQRWWNAPDSTPPAREHLLEPSAGSGLLISDHLVLPLP